MMRGSQALAARAPDGLARESPRRKLDLAVTEIRHLMAPSDRLALLLVDLDRFKLVNELCGPAIGDAVLDIIARERLGGIEGARMLHLGADEFACLLYFSDAAAPACIAQRMLSSIAEPIHIGQHLVHPTASIGLVLEDEPNRPSEDLLRTASIALSHAKAAGGDCIRRFRPEMFTNLIDRAELEDDLRSGMMRGDLMPYYQPIVTLDTGVAKGFEALIRWQHPRQGLLGPDHFLPIADELGLDRDLLFMMMRQVCRDARGWPPHFTASINMSPSQLCDPDNATKMLQILFASGLAPGRLIVEITESALIHNMASAHETIRSLRNTGIKVALDDFGTGYASLSRLCNLQIDYIKIDRSLISSLEQEAGRKLVKAVVDLGRSLSMPVTAEGIEAPEQVAFLRGLDCTHGQGYFFGRPAPAAKALQVAASATG